MPSDDRPDPRRPVNSHPGRDSAGLNGRSGENLTPMQRVLASSDTPGETESFRDWIEEQQIWIGEWYLLPRATEGVIETKTPSEADMIRSGSRPVST